MASGHRDTGIQLASASCAQSAGGLARGGAIAPTTLRGGGRPTEPRSAFGLRRDVCWECTRRGFKSWEPAAPRGPVCTAFARAAEHRQSSSLAMLVEARPGPGPGVTMECQCPHSESVAGA
jgi:hypothetical protein